MKVSVVATPPKRQPGMVEVRFVRKDQRQQLLPAVADAEFSAKSKELLYVRHEQLLYAGLGEPVDAGAFRSAAGAAVMFLSKIGCARVAAHLEDWPGHAAAALEGALLAAYRFERFKDSKSPALQSLQIRVWPADLKEARRVVERSRTIATATNLAREIANLPGNLLYPETLGKHAVKLARDRGLEVTVLREKELRAGGFGGLLAVGLGSARGPRLVVLRHRRGPKDAAPIALVGKAVTFDTGGISIKPALHMDEMIWDKCGGIAVLGAMAAIAELGLKRNVVGLIAAAENMPSATAFRPGDIVTTYDGKHVEIIDTDAEGRVVLADAIAYARKDCQAAAVVDLATLTGACGVALGEHAAGFWSSDEQLAGQLAAAAERAGERLWRMPLFAEYDEQIKSDVALVKNASGRLGGACTAAAFLKVFAEETPWAHLDIAYTAHRAKEAADLARGATGFGVRTLVELVEQWNPPASNQAGDNDV